MGIRITAVSDKAPKGQGRSLVRHKDLLYRSLVSDSLFLSFLVGKTVLSCLLYACLRGQKVARKVIEVACQEMLYYYYEPFCTGIYFLIFSFLSGGTLSSAQGLLMALCLRVIPDCTHGTIYGARMELGLLRGWSWGWCMQGKHLPSLLYYFLK